MSVWHLLFIGGFFLCFLFLLFWNMKSPRTEVVILGDTTIEVFIAQTLKETYTGLGGRDDMDGKDGMLFLFDVPDRHGIVMRDMRFPIDIVWLHEGRVVDIAPAVPTEPGVPHHSLSVYRPRTDATMVLELLAGYSAQHGLEIGDTLRLP